LTRTAADTKLRAFAPAVEILGAYLLRGRCVLAFGLKTKLAKLHFLVADQRDMLAIMIPYLKDMGIETVHLATDGPAALKILHQSGTRVDIVICDWGLGKLSGLEVLKFVRRNHGDMPFLMLASQVTREALATAAKHGVNGYLAKPFTVKLLETRVAALVRALPVAPPREPEAPDDSADQAPDAESWEI